MLVADRAAFEFRYGTVARIVGTYEGALNNGGERLALLAADGNPIWEFSYDDGEAWPAAADGLGSSLILIDLDGEGDLDLAAAWRSSTEGGFPGAGDGASVPDIWVNEVLTHTDWPQVDAVELFNPAPEPVDVSGWWLTDDPATPEKFRIPDGTVVPSQGYLVILEDNDADPSNNVGLPPAFFGRAFSLSPAGDEIYLHSADASGLTGFRDGWEFRGAANGVSFGRYLNSAGEVRYPAQSELTLGQANAGPRSSEAILSEVHYHPAAPGEPEWVEIRNVSSEPLSLFHPDDPESTWRLDGMGFDFPAGQILAPGEVALVVQGDLDTFRALANPPPGVKVYGPAGGVLDNGGERLALWRPDEPIEKAGETVVPMLVVDAVEYDDVAPWPVEADGQGASLVRLDPALFGDDPASWRASAVDGATPGWLPGSYVVTVTLEGGGSVERSPDQLEFAAGEAVSLSPVPQPGWVFARWTGSATGSEIPLTMTVNGNLSVTAVFEELAVRHALTTEVVGEGSIGRLPDQVDYEEGTQVTLSAHPAPSWRFFRWEGALEGTDSPAVLTMETAQTVRALFVAQVSLSIDVSGPGMVRLDPDKAIYDAGETVALTARPSPGASFLGWSGDAEGAAMSINVILDRSLDIGALFVNRVSLDLSVNGPGTVSVLPDQTDYLPGTELTLNAVASPGAGFAGWSGDAMGEENPLTVVLDADQAIAANFIARHSLSASVEGQGKVAVTPEQGPYAAGTMVELTATPAEGWAFVEWRGALTGSQPAASLRISQDTTVVAVFRRLYPLTVEVSGAGTVSKTPDAPMHVSGSTVALRAVASPEFRFVRWEVGETTSTESTLEVTVTEATTAKAVFDPIAVKTPYRLWAEAIFSEAALADPEISGFSADPDGDQLANLLEFAFQTHPLDRSSRASVRIDEGWFEGQRAVWVSADLRAPGEWRHRLEVSSDLLLWSIQGNGEGQQGIVALPVVPLEGGGERLGWRILVAPGSEAPRHIRLRVELEAGE